MRNPFDRYSLESVLRSPDDALASQAAPSGESAAAPPVPAAAAAADATAVAPAPAAPAPQADGKTTTESAPALLASADAGKRDGAPPAPDAKPGDVPPPGGADAKPDAKPADKPADAKAADPAAEPAKPPDGKTEPAKVEGAEAAADKDAAGKTAEKEQPPAPPVYDAWKVPDGVKLGDAETTRFNGLLGELENAKGDHAKAQEVGQKMVEFYLGEVTRIGDQLARHQVDVWNRHVEKQIVELKADPQFGGNRIETSLGNAKYVVEAMWGLNSDEAGKLVAAMDAAGITSNRLFIKALNQHYERYREPEPVPSLDPAASKLMSNRSQPGQRSWYDQVDGVTAPRA